MTANEIKALQRQMNFYAAKFRVPVRPIAVDGKLGDETKKRIRTVKLALGYRPKYATATIDEGFRKRLNRPLVRGTPGQRARGLRYRQRLRKNGRQTMRGRALEKGRSLLGVMETGNNTGPTVSAIIQANGGVRGDEWCGHFVAYCYRSAGSRSVSWAWAGVRFLGRISGQVQIRSPEAGDVVVYGFGHTGMFEKWLSGGNFQAIEGNTGVRWGEGVGRKTRHRSQVVRWVRVTR